MSNPPVKLSDVIEHLSLVSDDVDVYLNKVTGEFVVLAPHDILGFEDDDDFADANDNTEPDWLDEYDDESKAERELRRKIMNSDDYISLPDKFDIHDWQIMDDFCREQSPRISEELIRLIRGRGAFGRFYNAVSRLGLEKKWSRYRDQAYERIAREWLEINELAFIDEDQSPRADLQKPVAAESRSTERIKKNVATSNGDVGEEGRPGSAAPPEEIKVFISHQNSHCAECDEDLGNKAWITLERDKGALCLSCADLDQLVFLPAGDAALTRRSKKYSGLSAVVLRFSKARGRYERQGLLVEESAIEQAEAECLADSEVRERRNERARERGAELDDEYVKRFGVRIREVFPNCPNGKEQVIAEHACLKYSGRVGRSAAAKQFDEEMILLAVRAHVRHRETNYDRLLGNGWSRSDARSEVRDRVDAVIESWR